MSKPILIAVVAVLAAVCVLRAQAPVPSLSSAPPAQWQYKVLIDRQTRLIEPQLKQLGEQGWELVTVSESPDSPEGSLLFIFKRPAGRRS